MRDESLALLATVGDLIAAVTTVDQLLEAVCRVVVVGLADACVVDLIEPGSDLAKSYVADNDPELESRLAASRRESPMKRSSPPAVFAPLFSSRESLVLDPASSGGVTIDGTQRAYLAQHGFARLIAVPLLAGGRMLGMLSFIDRDVDAPYVPDIVLVAEEVARHVAVAVEWSRSREATAKQLAERTRAEGELRLHAQRQAALAAIGAEALQTVELKKLLEEVSQAIRDVLRIKGAAVFLVSSDENSLHVDGTGFDGSPISGDHPADPQRSMVGYTLASPVTVISQDFAAETRFDTSKVMGYGARSAVAVPLRDRIQALGVVAAFSDVPREFTIGEVHFLESVANVVGACLARQRQEDVLRERQQEFEALVEGAPDMIWRLDLEGRYVYVNAAIERLGIPRTAYFGRTVGELGYPPDATVALERALASVLERRREISIEFDFESAAEPTLTFQARLVPQFGRGGDIIGVLAVNRDVTEQRRANEHRLHAGEHLRALIENVSEVIVVLDGHGMIAYASPALEPVLGVPVAGAIGIDFTDLLAADDQALFRETIRAVAQGGPQAVEVHTAHAGAPGRCLEAVASHAMLEGVLSIVVTLRDVTARRALELQFRESQKMDAIGRLAGGVAHDFNNLLTVISSSTSFLLRSVGAGDPRREDLDEIEHAARRAASLTRQLLLFSRRISVQPRVVDVNELIRGAERMLRRVIGEDIEIRTELTADQPTVFADPGEIEQVLLNLVVNARDAMPEGGSLVVGTENAGEGDGGPAQLCISVRDTGIGIAPSIVGRIFEPFFTTKDPGKGTGLGLSTVYGIVTKAGGTVRVESAPGIGSSFEVFLPVRKGAVSPTIRPEPSIGHRGSETVLLVEDDEPLRRLARRALEEMGYGVLEASDGLAALAVVERHGGVIDLLLTDAVMPRLNGRELASRVRMLHPELPVLFMSGYTDDEMLRRNIFEPGTDLVQKPFTPEVLTWRVRQILDARPGRSTVRH